MSKTDFSSNEFLKKHNLNILWTILASVHKKSTKKLIFKYEVTVRELKEVIYEVF